jgi:hypothetical protein
MGRPLPGSKVKPRKGEEKYTVGSYLLQQQTPIPISEGLRATIQGMKEKGMSNVQIKTVMYGIMVGGISGFTGAKIGEEPKKKKR